MPETTLNDEQSTTKQNTPSTRGTMQTAQRLVAHHMREDAIRFAEGDADLDVENAVHDRQQMLQILGPRDVPEPRRQRRHDLHTVGPTSGQRASALVEWWCQAGGCGKLLGLRGMH